MADDRSSYEMLKQVAETDPPQTANESSSLVAKDGGLRSLSRTHKCVLFGLVLVEMSAIMTISMLAPFFPKQASLRGINATTTGWIFGVYALVVFTMSPVFGKLLPKFGCRMMIFGGELLLGSGLICFGLLGFVGDGDWFTFLSFLLRIFMAIGCAAASTAGFAVVSQIFEHRMSEVLGIMEASVGIGWMVGPALGGFLYSFGGFVLPFMVLGVIILALLPVYIRLMPGKTATDDHDPSDPDFPKPTSCWQNLRLFLNPTVAVMCLSIILAASIWSSIEPLLEPRLRPFQLGDAGIAGVFTVLATLYAISCPIVGRITDRVKKETSLLMMSLGFLIASTSLLFFGSSPILTFLQQQNRLWLNLLPLVIMAMTSGMCIIPPYNKIIDSLRTKADLELALHGNVAGLYNCCYALGEFIGPSSGGWLYDHIGFGWTMTVLSSYCLVGSVAVFILWLWQICRKRLTDSIDK